MIQSGKENERKQLESKTVEELRKICKECGISYYEKSKRLNKGAMIDKLLEATVEIGTDCEEDSDSESLLSDEILNACEDEEYEAEEYAKFLKREQEEAERLERRKKYIEQAKVGTIVAFKTPSGKVISAMITKKSTKGRKFMVETNYGVEYKISFDDVLWVRTNKRWPKGIYLLFKQNNKAEVTEDGKEIG